MQTEVGFEMDSIRNLDSAFPSAVSKTLEGVQANTQNPFWMFQISAFPFQNSVIEAIKYLRYFAKNVIEERVLALRNGKKTPNDILQHIVKEAQENSEIEMDDLVDNFLTIFTAGQETTLSQLSFTLYEVLNNPRIEERILKEVDEVLGHRETVEYEDLAQLQYLDQTLKEALRKYPPVPSAHRILQKEEMFGGFKIPAKTIVIVSCFNVHKSSELWESPDDFDPDRFSPSRKDAMRQSVYFPFFLGPRSCLGKTLAQFEAKVLMSRVLREFKFKILPGQTAKVEENITLRPRNGVICTLTQRNLSQVLKLKNMNEKRFVDHDTSVEDYVESLENGNTKEKTKRDVKLLETFLRNEKNDEREVQDIEPAELNKHLAEFIRSVRRKDGEDYEPSSLRCLVSSIERHLKKNNYTKSIINDKEFELFRKCLQAKQKELKKAGRGNKDKAAVAITDEEVDILHENNLLGVCSAESLLNTVWLNNTIHRNAWLSRA
ncbi:cholesterol 24-hydroxylase-like [Porites lutea]|uniref:cholesterol 24-hydroxylase-like n=1 Tax=Porites lutea TaxID=51062 RepID=UPI003CC600D5